MSAPHDKLDELAPFKKTGFPAHYPANMRTFYAPVDDPGAAVRAMFTAARSSLVIAYYGFDDKALADIIAAKLAHPDIFVQLTLDSSQAAGAHERGILAAEHYPASSIAIGRSEGHAIMHLKLAVIDGLYRLSGSLNLSLSAETKQDNEMTVVADPYVAAEARARIDVIHTTILNRAAA